MSKLIKMSLVVVGILLIGACPVLAEDTTGVNSTFYGNAVGAGVGAGLILIGAGLGFGRIGSAALESMARQPEVAGRVQTAMLIIAALLEGATFFGLIVCIIMSTKA